VSINQTKGFILSKIVNRNHVLGIINNRKVSGSVICYFQPKIYFFDRTFFFRTHEIINQNLQGAQITDLNAPQSTWKHQLHMAHGLPNPCKSK
jgi:hypothetical protein